MCLNRTTCLPTLFLQWKSNSVCWSRTKLIIIIIISSKCSLFLRWYNGKLAHLALKKTRLLTHSREHYKIIPWHSILFKLNFDTISSKFSFYMTKDITTYSVKLPIFCNPFWIMFAKQIVSNIFVRPSSFQLKMIFLYPCVKSRFCHG